MATIKIENINAAEFEMQVQALERFILSPNALKLNACNTVNFRKLSATLARCTIENNPPKKTKINVDSLLNLENVGCIRFVV